MPVSVSLAECRSYDPGAVAAAMTRLLAPLGGMRAFVRPGLSVLLKPNLLSDSAPDRAVTTHPEVVRAAIRLVRAAGGEPMLGDSPSAAVKSDRVWELSGMKAVCREESVRLLNLEEAGSEPLSFEGIAFSLARPALNAGLVINLPKLKTHSLTLLTNAVKNLYGLLPGYQKTTMHQVLARRDQFGRFLAHIYRKIMPGLTISDAVVGMDGDGPSNGEPVAAGFLAASADGAALDSALCGLVGLDRRQAPYLAELYSRAGGEPAFPEIRWVGDSPAAIAPPAFRPPRTAGLTSRFPPAAVRVLAPLVWIRPRFRGNCVRCGTCVKSCPTSALAIKAGRALPRLAPSRCIGCCCCHEVCPVNAIEMRGSPLLRLVTRGHLGV